MTGKFPVLMKGFGDLGSGDEAFRRGLSKGLSPIGISRWDTDHESHTVDFMSQGEYGHPYILWFHL